MALESKRMKIAMKSAWLLSKIGVPLKKAAALTLKIAWKTIGGRKK